MSDKGGETLPPLIENIHKICNKSNNFLSIYFFLISKVEKMTSNTLLIVLDLLEIQVILAWSLQGHCHLMIAIMG